MFRRHTFSIAIVLPALLASCTTAQPAAQPGVPDPVMVAPEGSAVPLGVSVRVGRLVATPLDVEEDSRCPPKFQCIRAGQLVVSTRVAGDGWQETVSLTLGKWQSLHGTQIRLADVPAKEKAGSTKEPGRYRFAFEGGT